MNEELSLSTVVSYWDVDRDQRLTLSGIFKLLQEGAIKHADQFDLGSKAMAARGDSWVLNRMAVAIHRYPRYEEAVKVVTWSSGIRGFRGYRDFRVCAGDETIISASSLWLYINLQLKMVTRVPPDLAAQFPTGRGQVFRADLDKLQFTPPGPAAPLQTVSLRYSDFDGNGHMNNTAYIDCLQTALSRQGLVARPSGIEVQFLKEIAPSVEAVRIALEPRGQSAAFAISGSSDLHAQGLVTFPAS